MKNYKMDYYDLDSQSMLNVFNVELDCECPATPATGSYKIAVILDSLYSLSWILMFRSRQTALAHQVSNSS